MKNIQTLP